MPFSGKIVLITGADRGIGREIATEFLSQNATVIGTGITEDDVNTINEYLGSNGRGVLLNVTEQESIDLALKSIQETHGDVDILINNAGITRDGLLMRMKDEDWDSIIDTNLTSVYRMSKSVLRAMMKKRKGAIINMASVVASMGNAGQTNYSAAKAGMIGFTKSLAQEVASRNITVNAVAPGFVRTAMTDKLNAEQKDIILSKVPMKRLAEPVEIAKTVVFLASDSASYITGQTIHVNGGMYMA